MTDGELLASWEPGDPAHVLVLRFADPEDMLRTQERITKQLRGWTAEGERYDKVETVAMTYGQVGSRDLMDGRVATFLVVTTPEAVRETEAARNEWAHGDMLKEGLELERTRLADAMDPSSEQEDWFDKWVEEAVVAVPAEGMWMQAAKSNAVRAGFNSFVSDYGRPELAFSGSGGGRAFSALLQRRFADDLKRASNDSGNPYFLGLTRKSGAKSSWFPNTSQRAIS